MTLNILNFKINLSPREWVKAWGEALANTWQGLKETFSNRRLWVGFAVSVLLHLLVILLSLQHRVGAGEELVELTDVDFVDESYNPKARKIIAQESKFIPGVRSGITEEAAPLSLERRNIKFQAPIAGGEISLEKGAAPTFTGEVLRINPNARVSTEEILAQAPIDLKRGMGGVTGQKGFLSMPQVGAPIDLSKGSANVEEGLKTPIKPIKPRAELGEKGGAEKALRKLKKTGFKLEGDLSAADIVAKYMPPYPAWARQRFLQPICKISFSVDANGNVMPVMTVLRSTGYPNWDEDIKRALRRWKFKPSNLRIRRAIITFVFVLE